jgi:hypothetical protein
VEKKKNRVQRPRKVTYTKDITVDSKHMKDLPVALILSVWKEVRHYIFDFSTPQYVLMTWCLVKHRENFT